MDGQVVANEILNLDAMGWNSVLGIYFNPNNYVSSDSEEESDVPEEENSDRERRRAEKERKTNEIDEAWEVCRIRVIKAVQFGNHLAVILQALAN
ncbi:hypothetical protein SUGI_0217260 [Cryptomeria japonica]|nr:hypothetical protein SUGI_0217260 [Cryptomeria japonica]